MEALVGIGKWLALVVSISGCTSLLPHGRSEQASSFASFEAAENAVRQLEPYRSTVTEMQAVGLDTTTSANVRQIPYPQFVALLVESPYLPLAELDGGIRECIAMREQCRAYQFQFSRFERRRAGHFLLDFVNIRRVTHTKGWRFEAIVLLRADGLVLFRNHAGEPRIESTEETRNPLGPFQSLESAFR